jgi:hypothetical protein
MVAARFESHAERRDGDSSFAEKNPAAVRFAIDL